MALGCNRYERLDELDSAAAEAKAAKLLYGLGFSKEMQHKKCKDFSGGWCVSSPFHDSAAASTHDRIRARLPGRPSCYLRPPSLFGSAGLAYPPVSSNAPYIHIACCILQENARITCARAAC